MTTDGTKIALLINQLFEASRQPNGREFSNQEVAHALGVHSSYIGKLRAGKVPNPGRDTLKQLCIFFQVPSSYFFPELEPLEASQGSKSSEINLRRTLQDFGLDEESR